jgi:RNase P/RNase MRP subunit p29
MSDDFDIDKFLNDSFANVEKKFQNKSKKVEKLVNKYNKVENATTSVQEEMRIKEEVKTNGSSIPKFNLNDYSFENVINTRVFEELSLPNLKKSENVKLESILKPLFPNDKVYEKEFKNVDKNFILDRFIGNSRKTEKEDVVMASANVQTTSLKINKFKKVKESELIQQLKNDPSISYSELFTMHNLWNEYISILMNKSTQPDTINSKMLKADLHGAIIEVIASKNSNQKGIKGLNLLETRRTFNLLGEDNILRTILKKSAIFQVKLPYSEKNFSVKIIGDNFMYKAVERTKAKFKNKYNL